MGARMGGSANRVPEDARLGRLSPSLVAEALPSEQEAIANARLSVTPAPPYEPGAVPFTDEEDLGAVRRAVLGRELNRLSRWTAPELMAAEFAEPRWAVSGIIPEGLTLLAGKPKIGKSWLTVALSVAVATGGVFLGEHVEAGDALLLALEDSPRRLQGRLGMILDGAPPPRRLTIWTETERLDDGGLDALGEWLEDHPDARLVVIDTWARLEPERNAGMRGAYRTDYDPLAKLQDLALDAGVTIVVVWHFNKSHDTDDWLERLSGTTGMTAAADAVLGLIRGRGDADAYLKGTGRDFEDFDLALRFNPSQGLWIMSGTGETARMSATRRVLYKALEDNGASTPKQVAEITDVPHESVKKTLRRMAHDGDLVSDGGVYDIPAPVSLNE